MKRKFTLGITVVLVFVAVLTNPGKDDYRIWFNETYMQQTGSVIGNGIATFVGNAIMSNMTSSKNFVLFTIYKTGARDENFTVLGVFNNFIPLSAMKEIKQFNYDIK